MLQRAKGKKQLEQLVIQKGNFHDRSIRSTLRNAVNGQSAFGTKDDNSVYEALLAMFQQGEYQTNGDLNVIDHKEHVSPD